MDSSITPWPKKIKSSKMAFNKRPIFYIFVFFAYNLSKYDSIDAKILKIRQKLNFSVFFSKIQIFVRGKTRALRNHFT